ncbi:hypothetical protein EGT07_13125 [Herbaspirillum sp. HC18]|nr:hypothetical protein EGT07_13125 [Herbaspirillum sp. HC18]
MSQEIIQRSRTRRSGVQLEEEKAWISFYRRIGNPAIATEVMHQLESDPEMKRAHLALYLHCKESLRMQKVRQARHKRIGQFVRMLAAALFVAPAHAVLKLLRQSGAIAVECLPELRKEPAKRRIRGLAQEAEFAQAQSEFDRQTAVSAPRQTNASGVPTVSSPDVKTGNDG